MIIVYHSLLDNSDLDELLDVLVECDIAHTETESFEFGYQGKLIGLLEDIADQREPCLLSDEVLSLRGVVPSLSSKLAHLSMCSTESSKVIQSVLTNIGSQPIALLVK